MKINEYEEVALNYLRTYLNKIYESEGGGGGGSQLISKSPILEGVLFKINCEDISMCMRTWHAINCEPSST